MQVAQPGGPRSPSATRHSHMCAYGSNSGIDAEGSGIAGALVACAGCTWNRLDSFHTPRRQGHTESRSSTRRNRDGSYLLEVQIRALSHRVRRQSCRESISKIGAARRRTSRSSGSSARSCRASHASLACWSAATRSRPWSVSSTQVTRPSWASGTRRTQAALSSAVTVWVMLGGRTCSYAASSPTVIGPCRSNAHRTAIAPSEGAVWSPR